MNSIYIILLSILIFLILLIFYYNFISLRRICNGKDSLDYFVYNNEDFNEKTDKTILILTGTHGNEPAGHYAIKDLINNLNSSKIKLKKGRLILIPSVNYCALKMDSRFILFIGDINRKYPKKVDVGSNNIKSNIKSNINRKVSELVEISDFILDFHEGWGFNKENKGSIGSTFSPGNSNLAENLSLTLLQDINSTISEDHKKFRIITDKKEKAINKNIYMKVDDVKGTLRYYSNILKKDYILVETTGQNNKQPLEIRVNQSRIIINDVLKYFGIL